MTLRNLNGDILHGWHQQLTDNGLPYYISSTLESSQWFHPEYVVLLQRTIQNYCQTRYTAYRTAQKLAHLQDSLDMSGIGLQSVVSAFASVGLGSSDCNDDHITVQVTQSVLEHLYGLQDTVPLQTEDGSASIHHQSTKVNSLRKKCSKNKANMHAKQKNEMGVFQSQTNSKVFTGNDRLNNCDGIDKSVCVELLINLLLNLFDQSRQGLLPVLGCKLSLLCLCCTGTSPRCPPPPRLHAYLHAQLSDYSSAVPRAALRRALLLLARLPELLGEELCFGRATVESCVRGAYSGQSAVSMGLSESELLTWLRQEPQGLVWWSTLYRLRAAATVVHCGVQCSSCRGSSPAGLVYVCQRCVNCLLCQECFLQGRAAPPHTTAHPLQEYCTQVGVRVRGRELLQRLSGRLGLAGSPKQRYLPPPSGEDLGVDCSSPSKVEASAMDSHGERCVGDAAVPGVASQDVDGSLLSRTITVGDEGCRGHSGATCGLLRIKPSLEEERCGDEEQRGCVANMSSDGECASEGNVNATKKKHGKKGLMKLLFRTERGEAHADHKPRSRKNKENMELSATASAFTRYNPKSRSFGCGGEQHQQQYLVSSIRYGSCRMKQPLHSHTIQRQPSYQQQSQKMQSLSSSQNKDSAGFVKPTAAATTVKPTAPATTVKPTAAATTVKPTAPATTVKPTAPATTVKPTAPATTVKPTAPAATVKPTAPAATVLRSSSAVRCLQQNSSNCQRVGVRHVPSRGQSEVEDPASPRQQLLHVIQHLQDGHSTLSRLSLCGPGTSTVLRRHTAQLQQHVAALRRVLQSLESPVGVVPPRPRTQLLPQLDDVPAFESSTPIAAPAARACTAPPAAVPYTSLVAPPLTVVAPPLGFQSSHQFHNNGVRTGTKSDSDKAPSLNLVCEQEAGKYIPCKGEDGGRGLRSDDRHAGLWPSLSPIHRSLNALPLLHPMPLDDTAVQDNKQNHWVEQPSLEAESNAPPQPQEAESPETLCYSPPLVITRLPSFTEVNFSDLTAVAATCDRYSAACDDALACSRGAGDATFTTPGCAVVTAGDANACVRDVAAGTSGASVDSSCLGLQLELEQLLQQLDAMFPAGEMLHTAAGEAGVVCAAQELDDCLAEYVRAVPGAGRQEKAPLR